MTRWVVEHGGMEGDEVAVRGGDACGFGLNPSLFHARVSTI